MTWLVGFFVLPLGESLASLTGACRGGKDTFPQWLGILNLFPSTERGPVSFCQCVDETACQVSVSSTKLSLTTPFCSEVDVGI